MLVAASILTTAEAVSGQGNEMYPSVSSGYYYTCALRTDGTVACWGSNDYGQATPPAGTFSHVGAGDDHSCGLKADGTVVCWGIDPSQPEGRFSQISAGGSHTCGVSTDDKVVCWGSDGYGESSPP